jgi:hypothetical protein
VGQDAVSANASYRKALDDATESVKEYVKAHGRSAAALDESTTAGAANADMLGNLAKKNEDAAKAQFALDNNTDTYVATLVAGHQAVIDHALALGATADQAQALADKVAAIPSQKQIQIIADTAAAAKTIDQFIAQYGRLTGTIMYRSQNLPKGTPGTFADGGYTGAGPRNKVAGVVHAGEWVSTARTTANPNNRAALEYMHAGGVVRGYAGGGYVAPVYSPAPASPWSAAPSRSSQSAPLVSIGSLVAADTDDAVRKITASQRKANALRGIGRVVQP